jgi:tetratricopeptide (TPR) repeat protein
MRWLIGLGLIWALCGAAQAQTPPRLLIGQLRVVDDAGKDLTVPAGASLRRELDQDGRVEAVQWSPEDARFAALAREAGWRPPAAPGSLEELLEGAAKLRAGFAAFLSAARHQGQVVAQIQLFRDGREVWRDGKTMRVEVAGTAHPDAMADSLARTWAQLMFQGPLAGLPHRPRIETPAPEPGPVTAPESPAGPAPPTPEALVDARRMIRQGLRTEAILQLRAAIDARPFDLELRTNASQIMLNAGLAEEAASEARRTAGLAPERLELRLLAARAWLQAGRPDEARADLNEALARNVSSAEAHLIHGEVLAATGQFDGAIQAFARARELGESYEARLGIAYAEAVRGQDAAVREALRGLLPAAEAKAAMAYRRWMSRLDAEAARWTNELQEIQRLVRARRVDDGLRARASAAQTHTGGLALFAAEFPAHAPHKASHSRRALALLLLAQAAAETQAFVLGDAEAGVEGSLTLSEAGKQFAAARQQWEQEGSDAPNAAPPPAR